MPSEQEIENQATLVRRLMVAWQELPDKVKLGTATVLIVLIGAGGYLGFSQDNNNPSFGAVQPEAIEHVVPANGCPTENDLVILRTTSNGNQAVFYHDQQLSSPDTEAVGLESVPGGVVWLEHDDTSWNAIFKPKNDEPRRIGWTNEDEVNPRLSPDGSVVLTRGDRTNGYGIVVVYPDGTEQNLTDPADPEEKYAVDPELSSDGSILYYSSSTDGENWQAEGIDRQTGESFSVTEGRLLGISSNGMIAVINDGIIRVVTAGGESVLDGIAGKFAVWWGNKLVVGQTGDKLVMVDPITDQLRSITTDPFLTDVVVINAYLATTNSLGLTTFYGQEGTVVCEPFIEPGMKGVAYAG